jgi:hypothetical protein
MKRLLILLLFASIISCKNKKEDKKTEFITHFESSDGKETPTYSETIEFYMALAKEFPEINIQTVGETDSGYPLHVVTYNPDGDFNFKKIAQKKTIILINNGIHPGESDGIDASMLLFRDLGMEKLQAPKNVVLVTIPIYNVGGALNRNSTSRVNQNGPETYGFRGNSKNYDLNRDFIKNDTRNGRTFAKIFHLVKPDIFIDNHVSNGADYQYTLTHIFTQHDKLGNQIGEYFHREFTPILETSLRDEGWDITPFVNVYNQVPENGFSQFMDSPRYSTGYTTLWNTLGMMLETHMLKPYEQRVKGTYTFLKNVMIIAESQSKTIKEIRNQVQSGRRNWEYYPLAWKIDSTRTTTLNFKGYEADTIESQITGLPRLKYDRNRPFDKEITYLNYFIPEDSVKIPEAYIVRKAWKEVINLMDLNGILYSMVKEDTSRIAEVYKIKDYKTRDNAYEGHYPHYDTEVSSSSQLLTINAGDYIIPTDQEGIRYILETLEPAAVDSFFNWNFFDPILQQKEGFSPYVFEDLAIEILENNVRLRESFEFKKEMDQAFSQNSYDQLQWIYEHSKYYETSHLQYPVYRIPKDTVTK